MDAAFKERRRTLLNVLYAEDFEAPPPPPELPDPPPEGVGEPETVAPSLTADDIAAARAEGREAGRVEAERGVAASRVQVLGLIAQGMGDARAAATEVAEATALAVARTIFSALVACLPVFCRQYGEGEVRELFRNTVLHLNEEPRIAVRVHPLMTQAIADEIATLDQEITERIVVIPAEQLLPGDIRVNWRAGSLERDTKAACAAVKAALAEFGLLEEESNDA